MAIDDWSVALFDATWVVHDYNLGNKAFDFFWGIIILASGNTSSFDLIGFDFDVDSYIVSRNSSL